jgi:electron transfer flavoprotein beta subunit
VNIAVCIKQVPDTEARIKISDDKKSIQEGEINFILNPYDEFAVEEALRLKEKHGGDITVIALGPDRVTAAIRTALAMGVTKAVHIKTGAMPADPLVVATALAEALKQNPYDLILLGKQAIDDDHAQMPALLSEILGLPAVSVVIKLEIEGRKLIAEREADGGHEIIEAPLPAIIGAQRGLNEPRYPSLKGIMQSKKIAIDEQNLTLAESRLEITGFNDPPAKNPGKIVGSGADAVPELLRLLHDEARLI